jgi:ethanolamine permease
MSLKSGRLGWVMIATLSIAIVIAGQFSGWNYGLAGGWANMFVATLLVAVLYLGIAFCTAELAAAMPSAGGFATYIENSFGPFAGFLTGVAIFLALSIGMGAAANFIDAYTSSVIGIGGAPVKAALFIIVIAIHLLGAGEGMMLVFVAGAVALFSLMAFIGTAMPYVSLAHLTTGGQWNLSLAGVVGAVPFAVWLFLGVEQAAAAAEESHDPGRTMPQGLITGICVLLFTALGVLIVAPGVAGSEYIATANDPLVAAVRGMGDEFWIINLVGVGAIFGLGATFFSLCFSASRQLFALARQGAMPAFLASTNGRGSPAGALVTVGLIGSVASLAPPEDILVGVVLLLSSCYVLILLAFIVDRRKRPDLHRPFRAPGGQLTALFCLPLAILVVAACFQISWTIITGLVLVLIFSTVQYSLRKREVQIA